MINEHELQLVNEMSISIYKRGYDEGVKDGQKGKISEMLVDTYTQGLNDAWECARKIMQLPNDTQELFYLSAKEAITKIKEYEEKDKHKCKECKWDEFRDAQSPVGTPCDSCFEGKNFSPKVARGCSILDDICPYDIKCEECEVHCSIERAMSEIKATTEV